jgi:tetratricopeptide (TPR) repeat protein
VEDLGKAARIHPAFPLAFNELGVQHLLLGDTGKAADAFREAIKLAPDAATPHLDYGLLLLRQKDFSQAEQEFRAALKQNDRLALARLHLGRCLISLKRLDEAAQELQAAIQLNAKETVLAHRWLGFIHSEKGRLAEAVAALEKYLELAPKANDAEQVRAVAQQLREQMPKP